MKAILTILTVFLMVTPAVSQISVKFDQYKLDNGLTVVLHEDHSVPVTAVVVMYHVGSKNEKVIFPFEPMICAWSIRCSLFTV